MGKIDWSQVSKNVSSTLSKNAPGILTGFGVAGMFTAIGFAIKDTPKAVKLIEEKKKETGVDKLKNIDVVKTVWKCYIPTFSIALCSAGCLIGSSTISGRRNAVLATAYEIAKTTHREYRQKVIETIGEKKEELVRDKVAKEKLEQNPVKNCEVIVTDMGDTLCYDTLSGRYFKTDIHRIKQLENKLNLRLRNENYVSLNEFYDGVGLERINLGDDLGWNIDDGYLELKFSSQLDTYDRPCLVIMYSIAPKHDYQWFN